MKLKSIVLDLGVIVLGPGTWIWTSTQRETYLSWFGLAFSLVLLDLGFVLDLSYVIQVLTCTWVRTCSWLGTPIITCLIFYMWDLLLFIWNSPVLAWDVLLEFVYWPYVAVIEIHWQSFSASTTQFQCLTVAQNVIIRIIPDIHLFLIWVQW